MKGGGEGLYINLSLYYLEFLNVLSVVVLAKNYVKKFQNRAMVNLVFLN